MNPASPVSLRQPFLGHVATAPASWHPEGDGHDRARLADMSLAVREAVAADGRGYWVVSDENAALFLAGLLGVLAAGARVIMPQHIGRDAVLAHVDTDTGLVSSSAALGEAGALDPARLPAGRGDAADLRIDPRAPLTLFTSGSTGEPKRVDKSLQQLDAELQLLERLWGDQLGRSRIVATVPHYHLYGLLFRLLWPFASGRVFPELALLEPPRIVAACADAESSVLVSSPAHLKRWPGFTALHGADVQLPIIFSSAGPLPAETSRALHQALDPISVWEVYGSTETGGIARRDQGAPGFSDWHPFEGVALDFPEGEPGRLAVKSEVCGGQWMDTGDRAETVGAAFRLLGRDDGVIKVEDRRVSLAEIEQALEASEWVAEAAVLRLEGARQTTAAALVLTEAGRQARDRAGNWRFRGKLRDLLADRFTEVVLPRRFRYLDSLPRNAMGKLQRRDLLSLFERSS